MLSKSRRRCCLCFHLEHDLGVKEGQLAHLDHDPFNSIESNLVWLCLPHHNQYDSRTSQSKGLTREEVEEARDRLYNVVRELDKQLLLSDDGLTSPFLPLTVSSVLISVYDKRDLESFAEFLTDSGCHLIGSPGTVGVLRGRGINCRSFLEYTNVQELLGLRGTLHPYILAGLKADNQNERHNRKLKGLGLSSIDLVIINSLRVGHDLSTNRRQLLDRLSDLQIGGPAILRWAVRHWQTCSPLVDPDDYGDVQADLETNEMSLSPTTREKLFRRALNYLLECDNDTGTVLKRLWNQ